MNRMVSRLCACLVAFSLFAALCGGMVARAADGFDYNYTYTYDYWGDERQSPDAYRTSAMLSSVSLGLETPMRTPRGLTVSGNDIYIVDTGNNRILQVARDGESFTLTRVISEISGDITPNTLSAPQDVFVMADGTLFIADTNNNRILKADRNLNLLTDIGEAIKIPTPDGGDRFDGNVIPHNHFLCTSCGRLLDLELDMKSIEEVNRLAGENFDGIITSSSTLFYGECSDCIRKS